MTKRPKAGLRKWDVPSNRPPPTGAAAEAPPQHPQKGAPQQCPPAAGPYAADQISPYPYPSAPPLQQHLQAPAFHPQAQSHPLPQPSHAQFQAIPFPPLQPPSYPSFPPQPPQSYQYTPAAYPPSAQQQFNQHSSPVQGTPLQGAPYVQAPPARYGRWTTGLFGCFEDPANALMTICFPCLPFGQVAEILDNGQTSCATSAMLYILIACCCGVPCILSCTYRTKLRGKYGLPASPAPDYIVHCLCDYCAICQAYRELKNRGLDPSIGWHSNMARKVQQQQMATMAPPVNQTMSV
ncbi:protein PLANT CADMIUM RESISTANCE 6-like [Nymphaea colorata]|nr:protein PLANT CADMIUM RESISTANCE 6-like [Nymphaea colorata]